LVAQTPGSLWKFRTLCFSLPSSKSVQKPPRQLVASRFVDSHTHTVLRAPFVFVLLFHLNTLVYFSTIFRPSLVFDFRFL
jgi:hypothetical protein